MVKGKERYAEEAMERLGIYGCCVGKNGRSNITNGCLDSFGSSSQERNRIMEVNCTSEQKGLKGSSSEGTADESSSVEPQDADYYIPLLCDELEGLILARFPLSEYWKLCFLNKKYLALLKNGELFKIRRDHGVKEVSIYMLASGENSWWAFDRELNGRRRLPVLPSDICFTLGDKESCCAGTHLVVSGREINGLAIWRYELIMNRWYKGPSMINPRCLFASATCGTSAFVAGGTGIMANSEVLDTAEKYNPDTKSWEPLPRMKARRKLCSGCYMDNKFYVIGGRNEHGDLTCGEFFDEDTNRWILIENMLTDNNSVSTNNSPPLVAVVNNELYSLEVSSNQLKMYLKDSNEWKQLGPVPVRADFNRGWGVAFKSLGNELLVIGASSVAVVNSCLAMYSCCPDRKTEQLQWRPLNSDRRNRLSHFILNCSVMIA